MNSNSQRNIFIVLTVHAAIIAINEAIDKEDPEETMKALRNPSAMLVNMAEDLPDNYQTTLYEAKITKSEISRNKVLPTYFNIVLTRKLFTGLFSSCVICARLHLQTVSIPLEFAQINFCIKRIIYKTFIFAYS